MTHLEAVDRIKAAGIQGPCHGNFNRVKELVEAALDKLGVAYLAGKDWENAGIQLRQAHEFAQQLCQAGPTDLYFRRDLALTQEHMGQHAEGLGQTAEARNWYKRSLDTWQAWHKQAGHDIPFLAIHEARLKNRLGD